jgi:hypothetical protein
VPTFAWKTGYYNNLVLKQLCFKTRLFGAAEVVMAQSLIARDGVLDGVWAPQGTICNTSEGYVTFNC